MVESRDPSSETPTLTDDQKAFFSEKAIAYEPNWGDVLLMNSKNQVSRLIFTEPWPLKESETE